MVCTFQRCCHDMNCVHASAAAKRLRYHIHSLTCMYPIRTPPTRFPHSAEWNAMGNKILFTGDTWTFTVPETLAGKTVNYNCGVHGNSMKASFTVEGDVVVEPATEHSVGIKNFAFSPKALMGVKVGDTITWTNQEGYVSPAVVHTTNSLSLYVHSPTVLSPKR